MGRRVLMTGASGLIGGALLKALLGNGDTEVCCVLRAGSAAHLDQRRTELADHQGLSDDETARLTAVAGDIERPQWGLDAGDAVNAGAPITEIVHCAASTRFDLDLEVARGVNVEGVVHLVELARSLGSSVEHVHHVSSAFAVGRTDDTVVGPDVVARGRWRNSYEQSKWEAEEVLRSSPLPVTVYRPSIVVGDSRTGVTPHFRVLYEPMKWIARGVTDVVPCDPSIRLDVVPVDFVAAAIAVLSEQSDPGGTHLLAAGPDRSLSIGEFTQLSLDIGNRCRRHYGMPEVRRPRLVAPDEPDAAELYALGAAVMAHHAPYMLEEQLFHDHEVDGVLARRGVHCPAPQDYWFEVIDYAAATDFGSVDPSTRPSRARR